MKKIRKYFIFFLVLAVGVLLVGCDNGEDVVDPIAPTEMTMIATGGELNEDGSTYLLVENQIIFNVLVNDGATDSVDWALNEQSYATMTLDGNNAVVTGVSAGNFTITATSKLNSAISATMTIEVAESDDKVEVLINAKNEILAALPSFIIGDTVLPTPSNPNVVVKYRNSQNIEYINQTYIYDTTNTSDRLDYFYCNISYHGQVLDFQVNVNVAADATDNLFLKVQAVEDRYTADMEVYTAADAKVSEDVVFPGDTLTDMGTYMMATYDSDPNVSMKIQVPAGMLTYNGTYAKPVYDIILPISVIFTATLDDGAELFQKKVYNITLAGYTPEEVFEYWQLNALCPTVDEDGNATMTAQTLQLYQRDIRKKLMGITVIWTTSDEEILPCTDGFVDDYGYYYCKLPTGVDEGEVTLTGTFYYNYSNVEGEGEKYIWSEPFTIHITIDR